MTYWLILAIAVCTEICWALSLKFAQQHPSVWAIGGSIALSFINMGLLSYAMKGLPAGTAYAVWTGLGAVGVTIGSIILFGDSLPKSSMFFMALIITGVVGMKLTSSV